MKSYSVTPPISSQLQPFLRNSIRDSNRDVFISVQIRLRPKDRMLAGSTGVDLGLLMQSEEIENVHDKS